MFVQSKLTARQQQILWATVRHYIATAEPVGSKSLAQEYNLNVSPATIRNGMGALEKAGLLYQPYTSAGRVPSDSGYRIYVDRLMTPSDTLAKEVARLLREQLNFDSCSLEAVLRGAAQILSTLSGYISLITMPQTQTERLQHLQLVSMGSGKIMVVVVTHTYQTQSILMEIAPGVEDIADDTEILEQELQIISNFLNHQLRGLALAELSTLDWTEIDQDFQQYSNFIAQLLKSLGDRHQTPEYTRIQVSGVSEVLRLPEFSQLQQVQTILHLLEDEQEQLWPLIFATPESSQQVNIRIGSENPLEPIRSCTLISAQYYQNSQPIGSVGILGPTRMVYENAIALVEATANYLSEALR
ncbi:MAG: heat-inducible transcriptional repressor HrcA [Arthrospira sp. SH-MAG29]|nr:heat-inducible transcriptional repressor HrcA [Arthrospira sp. SH-MAG29]MBS0015752.1 heat-inducible transcriptional repressor HrcA [Arthrospira sp. SH-MAG29]